MMQTLTGWHRLRWMSLTAAAAILCGGVMFILHLLHDPRVVLLRSDDGAAWLRVDRPFDSSARFNPLTSARFAVKITVPDHFPGAILRVNALRRAVVSLDDHPLFDSGPVLENWKTVRNIPMPAGLFAGPHVLTFAVTNRDGPSMLRVICPELNLRSGSSGWAAEDAGGWAPAVPADRVIDPQLPPNFGPTARELWALSPFLIPVFLLGCAVMTRRPSSADWGSRMRWILLLAWGVLSVNNIFKVPLEFGYDADQHTLYIQYVADHGSLPRPDAGWQFFQSPLYYILSAMLQRLLLLAGVAGNRVPFLLRIIPLLCGGAMIELCYRTSRLVYPDRFDLQAITTVVGGLLPVNIYMSQSVSNEPPGAVMSGVIVLVALRFLVRPVTVQSSRALVFAGAAMGIALLTKINTILWIGPLGITLLIALRQQRANLKEYLCAIGVAGGTATAISGAWMVRNLFIIGKPFNLESSLSGVHWWQEPGYRTPKMFYEFGHVFARPIYNGLASMWDSLYGTMWGNSIVIGQPGWNFRLMSCGLWLALLPMMIILIGIFRAIVSLGAEQIAVQNSLRFSTLSIGCFLTAILYVYLTLPIYSCAKASYMLGTTPCIGLLAAAGFDRMSTPNRWLRGIAGGALICWAVTAYLTFFAT